MKKWRSNKASNCCPNLEWRQEIIEEYAKWPLFFTISLWSKLKNAYELVAVIISSDYPNAMNRLLHFLTCSHIFRRPIVVPCKHFCSPYPESSFFRSYHRLIFCDGSHPISTVIDLINVWYCKCCYIALLDSEYEKESTITEFIYKKYRISY